MHDICSSIVVSICLYVVTERWIEYMMCINIYSPRIYVHGEYVSALPLIQSYRWKNVVRVEGIGCTSEGLLGNASVSMSGMLRLVSTFWLNSSSREHVSWCLEFRGSCCFWRLKSSLKWGPWRGLRKTWQQDCMCVGEGREVALSVLFY